MKKILVVTKCLKKSLKIPGVAQFSFKGFYSGHKICSIQIAHESFEWEKDEEYVIYLWAIEVKNNCLQGKAIKVKKLSDFLMEN
jgi:hypothetical protein